MQSTGVGFGRDSRRSADRDCASAADREIQARRARSVLGGSDKALSYTWKNSSPQLSKLTGRSDGSGSFGAAAAAHRQCNGLGDGLAKEAA